MAKGDLINYANLKSMIGTATRCSDFKSTNSTGNTLVSYIIAPSFQVDFYAGVWGIASIDGSYTVHQYINGSWVSRFSKSMSGRNNSSQKSNHSYYYHNYNGSSTSGDDPREHLFKITSTATWTQGGSSWREVSHRCYVNGVELMTESQFNTACKTDASGNLKPIKGIQPMIYYTGSGTNTSNYTYLGTESAIISKYTSNPLKGTLIAVDSGTYKYCC